MSIFAKKEGELFKLIDIDINSEKKTIIYHFENEWTDVSKRITFQRYVPFDENAHIDLGKLKELLPEKSKIEL